MTPHWAIRAALLSTGLQQVASRPFSVSEWLAVHPQETTAAETVIMAAYGMGLQGVGHELLLLLQRPGLYPRCLRTTPRSSTTRRPST